MEKRTFNFGKVDFNGTGRKINLVTVDMELRSTSKGLPELSICGEVWNIRHTDCIAGGQCLDELYSFLKDNKLFTELFRLWKNYHLTGMHAGTVEQESCLENAHSTGLFEQVESELNASCKYDWQRKSYYDVACEVLKRNNLYTVTLEDGTEYKYGHSWLHHAIPSNDLDKIRTLLDKSKTEKDLEKSL